MRSFTLLVVFASAVGCGPRINVVTMTSPPRPLVARPSETVELFTTKLPSRAYVEVAVISAEKGWADQHLEALREKAGELGCDALVFTVMPHQQTVSGNGQSATAVGSSSATCVVWTGAAPTAAYF